MEVVAHQRKQHAVGRQLSLTYASCATNLEIINDAFSVQEIVRNSKEVPIKGLAPRILVIQMFRLA